MSHISIKYPVVPDLNIADSSIPFAISKLCHKVITAPLVSFTIFSEWPVDLRVFSFLLHFHVYFKNSDIPRISGITPTPGHTGTCIFAIY